jgi:lysozyme
MIAGLDISHHNDHVDFDRLASAGISFAFVKASEGRRTKDIRYLENYRGLKSKQILRGAYHFFYPQLDPLAQANNFLRVVPSLEPGDLPPVLDIEVSGEKSSSVIASGIQQWLDAVEKALGRRPIIYTGPGFWNSALAGSDAFSGYPLWVAHYTSDPAPSLPKGFPGFHFWQYSQSGKFPGIGGSVDMDWFNGTTADLRALAGL